MTSTSSRTSGSLPLLVLGVLGLASSTGSRLPLVVFQHQHSVFYSPDDLLDEEVTAPPHEYHPHHHYHNSLFKGFDKNARVLYQVGDSEEDLPICQPWSVCTKVDTYDTPWLERQCRCPGGRPCPTHNEGHTLTDRTRHFKLCEPIKRLPKCRYFRDITWTLSSAPDNTTTQVVHCHCPRGAVAYLIKRQAYQTRPGAPIGHHYSFACSPQSRLRCQRKEPCRLFTVRKRMELLDEVNTNTLCQCPHGHSCPRHHTDPGVIQGKSYVEENIRTYSGYCLTGV